MNLDFIQEAEDCKLKAYLDIAGIPTIGWGSLYIYSAYYEPIVNSFTVPLKIKRKVRLTDEISQTHADLLLREEAEGISSKITALVTVPLNDNQILALTSFCYNLGVQSFKNSTLRKLINSGVQKHDISIENNFRAWNKYHRDGKLFSNRGLTQRRVREYRLYCKEMEQTKWNPISNK